MKKFCRIHIKLFKILFKEEKKCVDCSEILRNNPSRRNKDGVYEIYPAKSMKTYAFCDMTTNGGGWTVSISCYKSIIERACFIITNSNCQFRPLGHCYREILP